MAQEAGLGAILEEHAHEYGNGTFENTPYPALDRFYDLIAAHETEQCAQLMDDMAARDKLTNYYKVAALAIRERKE
jgi:hypothetical protein